MAPTPSGSAPMPLTALARTYGHPVRKTGAISHRVLKYTGKSGLTPLSPFRAVDGRPIVIKRGKKRLYYYQQNRFYGFTTAELRRIGSMASFLPGRVRSTLNISIHPMFEKSKWDTEQTLPKHL